MQTVLEQPAHNPNESAQPAPSQNVPTGESLPSARAERLCYQRQTDLQLL
jgi:hypothetical protein